MVIHRTVFTYEDYRKLPDDGYRWEVLEGCMVREPAPQPLHQVIVQNLNAVLLTHVREQNVGLILTAPLDVLLSDENVVQPDIVFIPRERLSIVCENNISGAPALAVEVLSPSTCSRDRAVKRNIYERFGIQEYWIVDPAWRTVDRFVLHGERYADPTTLTEGDTLVSPLFPGLVVDVRQVFENPFLY